MQEISLSLIASKAEVNTRDLVGLTPLHLASYGHPCMDSVVTALLSAKAAVSATDNELGNTPLHEAVRKNRGGAVRDLLASKADPAAKNNRRQAVADVCGSPQMRELVEEVAAVATTTAEAVGEGGKKGKKKKKRGTPANAADLCGFL